MTVQAYLGHILLKMTGKRKRYPTKALEQCSIYVKKAWCSQNTILITNIYAENFHHAPKTARFAYFFTSFLLLLLLWFPLRLLYWRKDVHINMQNYCDCGQNGMRNSKLKKDPSNDTFTHSWQPRDQDRLDFINCRTGM